MILIGICRRRSSAASVRPSPSGSQSRAEAHRVAWRNRPSVPCSSSILPRDSRYQTSPDRRPTPARSTRRNPPRARERAGRVDGILLRGASNLVEELNRSARQRPSQVRDMPVTLLPATIVRRPTSGVTYPPVPWLRRSKPPLLHPRQRGNPAGGGSRTGATADGTTHYSFAVRA